MVIRLAARDFRRVWRLPRSIARLSEIDLPARKLIAWLVGRIIIVPLATQGVHIAQEIKKRCLTTALPVFLLYIYIYIYTHTHTLVNLYIYHPMSS